MIRTVWWTRASRGRMVAIEKKIKHYPSDLTDEYWASVELLLPKPGGRGRPRSTDLQAVVNARDPMVVTTNLAFGE